MAWDDKRIGAGWNDKRAPRGARGGRRAADARGVLGARWVGMKRDMGPFSQTCVGDFEGQRLPEKALLDPSLARRRGPRVTITTVRPQLPDPVEGIEASPCPERGLLTEEAA